MITVSDHPEGCIVSVRAQPGARKNAIVGEHNGALKIAVTAPAQDGRANGAILGMVREFFALKRSQVELLGGIRSRDKRVLLRGVNSWTLQGLLHKWRA